MDLLDLLAVQESSPTPQLELKSLLQHHSSKASIPLCSAFFIVQLSHPYITKKIRHMHMLSLFAQANQGENDRSKDEK